MIRTSIFSKRVLSTVVLGTMLTLILGVCAPALVSAQVLTRQLELGMTGTDVGTLQTFLATDVSIYPQGLVTNYFGFLTKSAVANFQSRNGIAAVGRVGPVTMVAINAALAGQDDTTEGAGRVTYYGPEQPLLSSTSVSTGSSSATITWSSNVPATARVMYSTVRPFSYRTAPSVTSSAGPSTAQSVTITGLQSNTTYYYVVESLDSQGNFSWSVAAPLKTQ